MYRVWFVLVVGVWLHASIHQVKLEPIERIVLKAAAGGVVVDAKVELEGKSLDSTPIVRIDDALDQIRLQHFMKQKEFTQKMLQITRQNITLQHNTAKRLRGIFERLDALASVSKKQKDEAYRAYSMAQAQWFAAREKAITLEQRLIELQTNIASLKDLIDKKTYTKKGWYLETLMVRKGEYVIPGTPIAKLSDLRRGKIVLFLSAQEKQGWRQKQIFINGKETPLRINKVWDVNDERFVSSYRAEIIVEDPTWEFDTLLKVELR